MRRTVFLALKLVAVVIIVVVVTKMLTHSTERVKAVAGVVTTAGLSQVAGADEAMAYFGAQATAKAKGKVAAKLEPTDGRRGILVASKTLGYPCFSLKLICHTWTGTAVLTDRTVTVLSGEAGVGDMVGVGDDIVIKRSSDLTPADIIVLHKKAVSLPWAADEAKTP
jgi:hypothetical protein